MKRIISSALLFLLFTVIAQAQWTTNGVAQYAGNDISYTYEGVADSLTTLGYGKAINIGNYNATLSTAPISAVKLLTSVSGKPFVNVIIYGSMDGVTYFPLDTLMNKDSVETINTTTLDLNGLGVQYIKPHVAGTTGGAGVTAANRRDTNFWFQLNLYKKD